MSKKAAALILDASGRHGAPGQDGSHGSSGSRGRDGSRGQDAGPAQPGESSGTCTLTLRSAVSDPSLGPLGVHIQGEAAPLRRQTLPAKLHTQDGALSKIVLLARGGDGGGGGKGGDGGYGGRGHDGADATRHSRGGHGGDGGDGGDGGKGSHGAPGGDGGACHITIDERDLYLLMAVEGCDDPTPYIKQGEGGHPGQHGRGGAGGSGGSGGSSYSWTERESYQDSQGNTQTRTTHHSNPGGFSGSSGSSGWTPTDPLYHGRSGQLGQYIIEVVHAQGQRQQYPSRFALALEDFSLHEDLKEDVDGILEFGEVVHVAHLRVRNVGPMPSPPMQRVRVVLATGTWVRPLDDELLITKSLAPGEELHLEGSLRFALALPSIETPGEPFIAQDHVRPAALQLGQEQAGRPAKAAPFQRLYSSFNFNRLITAQFPIENRQGIIGLRSLAAGERTRLRIDVGNVSQVAIGHQSPRARKVGVQVEFIQGDVDPSQVVFINREGEEIDLAGKTEGWSGYFEHIAQIEPHSSFHLDALFGFKEGVAPYSGVTLRATIWLEEHHNKDTWRKVQLREATFRAEPGYHYRPEARLVLVTNNNTSREAFLAWQELLDEQLGLPFDHWSLARYGHFDHQLPLEDGTSLKNHLEDKVAIVLNQRFEPRGTQESDLPTDYLKGRDVREGATSNNTHFLMVGSPEFDARQLLEPTSDVRRGGDDYPDITRFLEAEERTGGPLATETFKDDLTTEWDEVKVHDWTFFSTPDEEKRLKMMRKRSLKLMDELTQMHPNRRYVIVERPHEDARRDGRSWLILPRWELGQVEVRRTLNTETSAALVLHADDKRLNDPAFILSPQNRYAVFLALPFEVKLERLNWLLKGGDDLEGHRLESARALVDAIMTDLSEEQSALASGDYALTPTVLEQKLSNLGRLVREPLYTDLGVDAKAWWMLFELCASLEALIQASKTWRLWSRDRKIARYTEDQLKPWRSAIFDAHAITAQGDVAMDRETAMSQYHTRRDGLIAVFKQRRAQLEDLSGLKASLAYVARERFEHPKIVKEQLQRDIDVWTDPKERIWSARDFAQAQHRELVRHHKQEELRQINAQRRAELIDSQEPQTVASPEVVLDLEQVELTTQELEAATATRPKVVTVAAQAL